MLKIVVRLIRYSKTISIEEFKLIEYGPNFVRTNNKLGLYYDFITLISVYGFEHYQSIQELPGKVAEVCFTVLTSPDNLLPREIFKAILLL